MELESFMVHVVALEALPESAEMTIHLLEVAQLFDNDFVQVTAL